MADKARHAFGSEANIDAALKDGTLDAYDILFLDEKKIGWIDRNGNKVIIEDKKQIVRVEELPTTDGDSGVVYIYNNQGYIWDGEKCIPLSKATDITALEEKLEATKHSHEKIKYEITNKPEGTLVNYGEKEIRVMCPIGTKWIKQNVGENGDANKYYMGFKAYAPDDAVSFKEDDKATIEDNTMYYFENNKFAGIDEFGRKYSIVWLALASYDESSDIWTYFGKQSSTEKYVGWYYSVEWYNADGVIVASDCIRINLSNEECHSSIEPYYMNNAIETANAYTDAQIETKIAEINAIEIIEF